MSKPELLTIHHANTFLEFCPSFYTNHFHDDSNAVFLILFLSFRASKAIHVLYVSHIVPYIFPIEVRRCGQLMSNICRLFSLHGSAGRRPNTCGGLPFCHGYPSHHPVVMDAFDPHLAGSMLIWGMDGDGVIVS